MEHVVAEGFVHTVSVDAHWEDTIEGQDGMFGGATKAESVEAGRTEAERRRTEHVIHCEDGAIEERNAYGGDPSRRAG